MIGPGRDVLVLALDHEPTSQHVPRFVAVVDGGRARRVDGSNPDKWTTALPVNVMGQGRPHE